MEFVWWIVLAVLAGLAAGSMGMEYFKEMEVHRAEKEMNAALVREFQAQEKLEAKEEELRLWQNTFDRRVEDRLKEKIREWTPSVDDVEDQFRQAELMAVKRDRLDAGRSHPPRSDGGEPAKLSRIRFKR